MTVQVIITHSRGACDTLFFALNNPEFTEHHIRAMFLIQGPFGGSGLADFVMGEGPPVDNQLSPLHRSLATIFGDFERFKMKKGQHGGIADMTRDASHRFWTSAVESHPDAVAQIAPRIFYIEGETESSRLKLFLRATGSYLHLHYGPNDGVVARGDQSLRGLGTSLGVYNAGHSDLTRKNPGSKQGKRTRRAFVDAIFVAVGQPGGS